MAVKFLGFVVLASGLLVLVSEGKLQNRESQF